MKTLKRIIASAMAFVIASAVMCSDLSADDSSTFVPIVSSEDDMFCYIIQDDGNIHVGINNRNSSSEYTEKITIPESLDKNKVTGIYNSGFSGLKNITSVSIPTGVTDIESLAFSNCTSLKTVSIPNSITHIGTTAFSNTPYEDSIIKNSSNGFVSAGKRILYLYTGNNSNIEIPANFEVIADSAFSYIGTVGSDTDIIKSVIVPDSVKYIGNYAFYSSNGPKTITIGSGIVKIGTNAFTYNSTVIYGYGDSFTESYAKANGITFIPIISDKDSFKYEFEYGENFKQYYFSDEASFSSEGLTIYRRDYNGTKTEITDWKFDSTPSQLYSKSN